MIVFSVTSLGGGLTFVKDQHMVEQYTTFCISVSAIKALQNILHCTYIQIYT